MNQIVAPNALEITKLCTLCTSVPHYCLDQKHILYSVLYPCASRKRKGEGHKDQDAGEAGCQVTDHCMDLDEEKGGI